ncbi:MAG: hypothetical protein HYR60_17985 [Acidobacteria bacterium]|nr:hypothetical protein [Acidobacteriota bacterium]
MRVTIAKFRQDLFKLVERALDGEPVEFAYRGVLFKVEPKTKPSRLAKLTAQALLAPNADLNRARRDLIPEMQSEWEKDWSEL